MNCCNCGHPLSSSDVFCQRCGAAQTPAPEAQRENDSTNQSEKGQPFSTDNKKVKLPLPVIIGASALVLIAIVLLEQPWLSKEQIETSSGLGHEVVLDLPEAPEGSIEQTLSLENEIGSDSVEDSLEPFLDLRNEIGFGSPEEAVREYLEAMKKHDLIGITEVFAIDIYVRLFDFEAYLDRLGLTEEKLENVSITITPPTVETRLKEVFDSILYQHWFLSFTEFGAKDTFNIDIVDETALEEELLSLFENHWYNPGASLFQTAKLLGFIPPELLIDDEQTRNHFLEVGILRGNISGYAEIPHSEITNIGIAQHRHTGADKFENLVAVVEFDGNAHLIFVVAYAYGDKWYLESFGGTSSMILNISADMKNCAFPSEWFISDSELEAIMIPA